MNAITTILPPNPAQFSQHPDAAPGSAYDGTTRVGERAVDVSRGELDGQLSRQWSSRPDDQKFLTLDSLRAHLSDRRERSQTIDMDTRQIEVLADAADPDRLQIGYRGIASAPTNWSFGQLSTLAGAPAGYLRGLPASLAAINLQYGLQTEPRDVIRALTVETPAGTEFRAANSQTYGRVYDAEAVNALASRLDETWKVPGQIDWRKGTYNPDMAVTKQSTTLYASDRDVYVFLCRDQYPVEIGKLANGEPDLLFPGLILSNSETGSAALNVEAFYLRAVCQNRNLWGVDAKTRVRIRHTSGAPARLFREAMPALVAFSRQAQAGVAAKVAAAKSAIVAEDDEKRVEFLTDKVGLTKSAAVKMVKTAETTTENDRPRSVWDMVQMLTAAARDTGHQDARLSMERAAGRLMDKIAA